MTRFGYANEADFQQSIIDHARANGWYVHYLPDWMFRLALASMKRRRRNDRPWPDKGFPDLVMRYDYPDGRGHRVVVAELKTDTGRVDVALRPWLAAWKGTGVETYVWRASDTDAIIDLLQHPERVDVPANPE